MRILILSNSSLWGGLEVHTVSLAGALNAAGHQVSIVCFGDSAADVYRDQVPANVALLNLGPPDRRSLLGWWRAFRQIDADAAILEKGTLWTGNVVLDAALRARFRRYITIQQLEPPVLPPRSSRRYFGGLIPGLALWWYRWKFAGYLRSLAPQFTVCVSDAVLRALATDYGFSRHKLVTIRHGVDTERFRPDAARRDLARQAWKVPADALVFGSVRRFVRDKGLDVAIEAFATLTSKFPGCNARLVLIGEGPEESALLSLAERLGVAESVVFPGFTASPWEAYPAFDVFIIPSRVEALGVVVIEAMASECLVIGTRAGGIPEMMSDPPLGLLVPPGDAVGLEEAMRRTLLMTPDERRELAHRGRMNTIEHFDVQAQSLRIARLLE